MIVFPLTFSVLPRIVAPTTWRVLEPDIEPVATREETDPVPASVVEPVTFKYPEVSKPVVE